jgi:hypothetical protein
MGKGAHKYEDIRLRKLAARDLVGLMHFAENCEQALYYNQKYPKRAFGKRWEWTEDEEKFGGMYLSVYGTRIGHISCEMGRYALKMLVPTYKDVLHELKFIAAASDTYKVAQRDAATKLYAALVKVPMGRWEPRREMQRVVEILDNHTITIPDYLTTDDKAVIAIWGEDKFLGK